MLTKASALNLGCFRNIRGKNNRVDRNYTAGDQVGENAGAAVINAYDAKGVSKKTAGILYNVGLNSGGLADAADAGNTNATTFEYTPRHPNAVNTRAVTQYDLTDDDELMAYVAARSLDKDPLQAVGDTN